MTSPISDILREQLFWVARGTLRMAENIRLNPEEDEANVTFAKLDEQYYHKKYSEDDGSYRIQGAEQAITALLEAAILTTWNYTGEGYNGEYDGLTHNGGKRYTVEEVEAKVLTEVKELLGIPEKESKQ